MTSMYFCTICTFLLLANAQSFQGIWLWTWSGSVNLGPINEVFIFSGYSDASTALSNSASTFQSTQGTKWLTMGGGNSAGSWTSAAITNANNACSNKQFQGYYGVAFDIEQGDSGLAGDFQSLFCACKASGYAVLVTTSHSSPYGIGDASAVMDAVLSSTCVDWVSPQLYTNGDETSNDYSLSQNYPWSSYAQKSGKILVAITSSNLYSDAQSYFSKMSIQVPGYVQWEQTVQATSNPVPPTPVAPTPVAPTPVATSTTRCGSDWGDANSNCYASCSVDSDCTQHCYADLSACGGSSSTTRCGSDWGEANSNCHQSCSVDSDCTPHCYANLAGCSNAAEETDSGVYSSNNNVSVGILVGSIIGGVVLLVIVVTVIIVLVRRRSLLHNETV